MRPTKRNKDIMNTTYHTVGNHFKKVLELMTADIRNDEIINSRVNFQQNISK